MKTLDQIEPRKIVNATNTPGDASNLFIISAAGSYYLTGNITGVSGKNGIEITSGNVTLDLNGFALTGVGGSLAGIRFSGTTHNVTVRNGTVSNWSLLGINAPSGSENLTFERLNISDNTASGLYVVGSALVAECNSRNNTGEGIYCSEGTITHCNARYNGGNGFSCHGVISNCTALFNQGEGFYITSGTISGCYAEFNVQSGIYVDLPGSQVLGNTCVSNNTGNNANNGGIYVNDNNNRIDGNQVTGSGIAGISVNSVYSANVITHNFVHGNGASNYVTPGAQVVGPFINTSGTISSTNPWANFSY